MYKITKTFLVTCNIVSEITYKCEYGSGNIKLHLSSRENETKKVKSKHTVSKRAKVSKHLFGVLKLIVFHITCKLIIYRLIGSLR